MTRFHTSLKQCEATKPLAMTIICSYLVTSLRNLWYISYVTIVPSTLCRTHTVSKPFKSESFGSQRNTGLLIGQFNMCKLFETSYFQSQDNSFLYRHSQKQYSVFSILLLQILPLIKQELFPLKKYTSILPGSFVTGASSGWHRIFL